MKKPLFVLLNAGLSYLICSFLSLSIDFRKWDEAERFLCIAIFGVAILIEIIKNLDNHK